MSVKAGAAKLIAKSAGSKDVAVVFNSILAFKSSDKRHSINVYTKLMELKTNFLLVGSFL
jgi:hypothetical protein